MFEKEAEEWVKENMDCCEIDNSINQSIPYFSEEERCIAKSAFKDGAEFGYNKANEWHYVKDGDLPKGNGLFVIYWKLGDIDNYMIFRGTVGNLHEDVIAWREIIPSKESE